MTLSTENFPDTLEAQFCSSPLIGKGLCWRRRLDLMMSKCVNWKTQHVLPLSVVRLNESWNKNFTHKCQLTLHERKHEHVLTKKFFFQRNTSWRIPWRLIVVARLENLLEFKELLTHQPMSQFRQNDHTGFCRHLYPRSDVSLSTVRLRAIMESKWRDVQWCEALKSFCREEKLHPPQVSYMQLVYIKIKLKTLWMRKTLGATWRCTPM